MRALISMAGSTLLAVALAVVQPAAPVLMLSYANSPAMAVEFAAEGHPTAKPMTLLRVNQ